MLPLEIYHLIAGCSPGAYKAMLALPPFARDLTVCTRLDYMVAFGHGIEITKNSIMWTQNDRPHRLDGPAVEHTNGSREWWVNGRLHRLDGPAVEYTNGTREWWVNGKKAR